MNIMLQTQCLHVYILLVYLMFKLAPIMFTFYVAETALSIHN